ncbi:MAG: 16S rRNA (uracil(1498)-N(3))-methyltransferase [bacterium]|nr:16S rRNA (uracil(1498)-N(3))-methyltransferase [bacterium]
MRLHRFFIEEHLRNKKDITIYDDEVIHQWKDVFRLRAGDKVILLDDSGYEYLSEIGLLAKGKAEVKIIEQTVSDILPTKEVWLFASIIKKDNFEWILEKGTEVGVTHFVPVLSDRTEKKDINMDRAYKIVREATEQSGRGKLPQVFEPASLEEALENDVTSFIAFHMDGEPFSVSLRDDLRASEDSLGILIGPEGGWSDNELELFKEKNIPIYSLGKGVLRAETAAIVVPSLILL